ncbi:MAG: hypothetical protein FWG64_03180 [Firmicutes bacterium]|nr:hypothetical protein [Bacillota bacterium]
MYKYAQIDENNQVIGVFETNIEENFSQAIKIDTQVNIGDTYNPKTKLFVANPKYAEVTAANAHLTGGQSEISQEPSIETMITALYKKFITEGE